MGAGKAEDPFGDTKPRSPLAVETITMTPVHYPTRSGAAPGRRHAGSLEALRVARPEAVASGRSEVFAAATIEVGVERCQATVDDRHRHEEFPACEADEGLDVPLLVRPPDQAEM